MMQKIKSKIGLIGAGNMGSAILEGLLQKGLARPDQVWVYDKLTEKASEFSKKHHVHIASSNPDLIQQTEWILLAVKPQDLEATLGEGKTDLTERHVLISILAGTPTEKIRKGIGAKPRLVRAMPNLGAKVGQSITALTSTDNEALHAAEALFSGCGKTVSLEEKFFDLVTAVSGSGPAYFFLIMELLAQKGVEEGLRKEDAELLAIQTAAGAAMLAQSSGQSPEELRKMVTSKGGTTEAALKVLTDHHFQTIFIQALTAARNRGRELSQS